MKKIVVAFCAIGVVVGYILGCLVPIKLLLPIVQANGNTVTYFESQSFWVNVVFAFLTFCAVITALFKEMITGWFRKVKFDIQTKSPKILEEVLIEESGATLKARQYKVDFVVTNKGTIDAKNCALRVKAITYVNLQSGNKRALPVEIKLAQGEDAPRRGSSGERELAHITPEGQLTFRALTIENANIEKGQSRGKPSVLVGRNRISTDYNAGKLLIEYAVSCDNKRPERCYLNIQWDGKWKNRLDDILKGLTPKFSRKSEG